MEDKNKHVDNLINIVENHTRTKRHLEQYADIGDPYFKEMAIEKQREREEQIDSLRDKLTDKKETISPEEHFENLVEKYESTEGYIRNNADNMNTEDLNNLNKKQSNRREQILNMSNDDNRNNFF